jgi:hypothetical protein
MRASVRTDTNWRVATWRVAYRTLGQAWSRNLGRFGYRRISRSSRMVTAVMMMADVAIRGSSSVDPNLSKRETEEHGAPLSDDSAACEASEQILQRQMLGWTANK